MERVQRNGGTAGIVAGVLLIVLFFLFMSLRISNAQVADPGFMVPLLSKNPGTFMGVGIFGALVAGFAVVFSIGLVYRLREKAPTRALASLYLAVLGLGAHAADSMVSWIGGRAVGLAAAKDAVAAGHAYVAVSAVAQSLNAMANVFTGAALLVAAWAIIATGAAGSRPPLGARGVLVRFPDAGAYRPARPASTVPWVMRWASRMGMKVPAMTKRAAILVTGRCRGLVSWLKIQMGSVSCCPAVNVVTMISSKERANASIPPASSAVAMLGSTM